MSYHNRNSKKESILLPTIAGFLVVGSLAFIVGLYMWGMPKYRVYSQEMSGRAVHARAVNERRAEVEAALAVKDSAVHRADAEIIRARGVAEANAIIANGLGGPEGYLRYLAIDGMKEMAKSDNTTVVYVPTDGNIPVTEAARFNKPER